MKGAPMLLDPLIRQFLDEATAALAALGTPDLTVPERRHRADSIGATLHQKVAEPGPAVGAIREHTVAVESGRIRLRSYVPVGQGPFPGHVLLHGGGWWQGSIDDWISDVQARERSMGSGSVVVMVDYRLAPEHPFPTPLYDCRAAWLWVLSQATQDGTAASELQSAELQFRAHGVDTVFVEGVAALLFAEDAESQGWHPSYLMTDAGAAFEGNVPDDQLANFHGFGWEPSVDVDPTHQPYKWNASQQRCLQLLASQGLIPKGYNDFMEAFTTCDGLFRYAAALQADGGQTAAGPLVSALQSVIGQTLLSSTYDGIGRYVPAQHGGPSVWRQWGWATSCSCFEYFGPTHAVG